MVTLFKLELTEDCYKWSHEVNWKRFEGYSGKAMILD